MESEAGQAEARQCPGTRQPFLALPERLLTAANRMTSPTGGALQVLHERALTEPFPLSYVDAALHERRITASASLSRG